MSRTDLTIIWCIASAVGLIFVILWCLLREGGVFPALVVFVCGGGSWAIVAASTEANRHER